MARSLLVALALLCACMNPGAGAPTATTTGRISPTPTASSTPTASPTLTLSSTPGLMPIFDAHLHYSRESWNAYPPERVAALLDSLGIRSAFVSSAPDEGTFRLRQTLGDRIVPTLGPYRRGGDVFSWTRDGSILPYLESSYRQGVHRGFGEFHVSSGQVGLPVVRGAIAFARSKNLFLQPHADARAVAEVLEHVGAEYPVLWAHAGVTATPDQIDQLLDRWPQLWVELSLRDDVAPNGQLDSRWRALLTEHAGRFMVGTDTWTVGGSFTGNERWDRYAEIVGGIRRWLAQLPNEVAEGIAHRNAERFLAELPR